ncbi:MAG: rRNA maturation RNase YbeY [Desulfovibrionaceae bacterium]
MKRGAVRLLRGAGVDPRLPLGNVELRELLTDLRDVFGLDWAALGLRLVDDAEMAELNETFLGCKGPTNVLAFPAGEGGPALGSADEDAGEEPAAPEGTGEEPAEGTHLGEIALSVPTLLREAELYGQPPGEHLVRLLAHALLHLAGHDHGPLMDALTDQAVDRLRGRWG